jgi:hypothetical protein
MRRHAAAFHALASAASFDLQPDEDLDWLTRYGHLQPTVAAKLPNHALKAIEAIFAELGGDEEALRAKTRGRMDADFLLQLASGSENGELMLFAALVGALAGAIAGSRLRNVKAVYEVVPVYPAGWTLQKVTPPARATAMPQVAPSG